MSTAARVPEGGGSAAERVVKVARVARRRLLIRGLLQRLGPALVVAAAGMAGIVLVDRFTAWRVPGWVTLGVPLAAAVGYALLRGVGGRPSLLDAAAEVDDQARLRDRLSTAMSLGGGRDPFAALAVSDGEQTAATVDAARAVPLRLGRSWHIAAVAVAAAIAAWVLVPEWSPHQRERAEQARIEAERTRDAAAQMEQAIIEAREAVREVTPASAEHLSMLEELQRELDGAAESPALPLAADGESGGRRRPEEALSEAARALEQMAREQRAQAEMRRREADELADMLSELPADHAETSALAQALRRGDLESARQAVSELARQGASDEASQAERERVARELRRLADDLRELAERRVAAERAARQESGPSDGQADSNASQTGVAEGSASEAEATPPGEAREDGSGGASAGATAAERAAREARALSDRLRDAARELAPSDPGREGESQGERAGAPREDDPASASGERPQGTPPAEPSTSGGVGTSREREQANAARENSKSEAVSPRAGGREGDRSPSATPPAEPGRAAGPTPGADGATSTSATRPRPEGAAVERPGAPGEQSPARAEDARSGEQSPRDAGQSPGRQKVTPGAGEDASRSHEPGAADPTGSRETGPRQEKSPGAAGQPSPSGRSQSDAAGQPSREGASDATKSSSAREGKTTAGQRAAGSKEQVQGTSQRGNAGEAKSADATKQGAATGSTPSTTGEPPPTSTEGESGATPAGGEKPELRRPLAGPGETKPIPEPTGEGATRGVGDSRPHPQPGSPGPQDSAAPAAEPQPDGPEDRTANQPAPGKPTGREQPVRAQADRERSVGEKSDAEQPREQASDGAPQGSPPSPPPMGALQRLAEQLSRLSQTPRQAQQQEQSAERLMEQARRMYENASPEQREQMRRWAMEQASRMGERGVGSPDGSPVGISSATATGDGPGAGGPRARRGGDAGASPEIRTEPVDATTAGRLGESAGDQSRPRVIAEWLGDGDRHRGPAQEAMIDEQLREATRSAEQAIGDRSVSRRYDRVLQEYFRRLPAKVRSAAGQSGGGAAAPARDADAPPGGGGGAGAP